jgi:endonuclease YncB( thermonuclease family)
MKPWNVQKKIFHSLVIFFFLFINLVNAETISGVAKIIDADTIKINNNKIRLFGIDAPELDQLCKKKYLSIIIFSFYKNYKCGEESALILKKYLNDKLIKCNVQGKDRYKRYIAICYKNNKDIGSWLVNKGYAVSYRKYSKKYLNEEIYAKKNKLGIWQGKFEMPWNWRKKNKFKK